MTRRLSIAVLTVFLAGVASLVAMTGRGRSRPADESRATTDSASPSSLAAHAQAVDTAVSAPPRRPVMLGREGDEPSAPLVLESARYEVTVAGFAARTRATLTFRNDAGRVLEGEFVYPLPDTAVISGFALDVGGRMVDGVVVEAQQARIAFDTEVRKGIDPGLVEWVRGNTFRTRIWPLPARGRRTVTIEYISELAEHAATDGLDVSYELPLRPSLTRTEAARAAHTAFKMAGARPQDVDVAQLYDCFTITVLMTLEDYGFCRPGESAAFVADGALDHGGRLPLNTSGGLLSETGMPGMQLIIEGVRQMRGTARLQVPGAKLCVVSNQGGTMHTHATLLLGN